jgi:bla regulator protein BlaR1
MHILAATSWRATFLILVVFALRWLRRWLPAWVFPWLWLIVAVKLLLVVAPGSPWSAYNLLSMKPETAEAIGVAPPAVPAVHPSVPVVIASAPPTLEYWTALIWVLVVAGVLLRQAWTGVRFFSRLSHACCIEDVHWHSLLQKCALEIGVSVPRLLETGLVGSPAVVGLFRPKLLIPPGLLNRLTESEVRLVFLHELAHLRRCDLWLLALFTTARTCIGSILWYGSPNVLCARTAKRRVMRKSSDLIPPPRQTTAER